MFELGRGDPPTCCLVAADKCLIPLPPALLASPVCVFSQRFPPGFRRKWRNTVCATLFSWRRCPPHPPHRSWATTKASSPLPGTILRFASPWTHACFGQQPRVSWCKKQAQICQWACGTCLSCEMPERSGLRSIATTLAKVLLRKGYNCSCYVSSFI